jgi:protein-L-isoaspartate O-methyltransferase
VTELKGPNSDIVEGILLEGWADSRPYDVILLEGSVPQVPKALFAQLKEAGRLVGVLTRVLTCAKGRPLYSSRRAEW